MLEDYALTALLIPERFLHVDGAVPAAVLSSGGGSSSPGHGASGGWLPALDAAAHETASVSAVPI